MLRLAKIFSTITLFVILSLQIAHADEVMLTISGNSKATDGGKSITFTLAEFENIGLTKLKTRTPWNSDPIVYEGVSGAKLHSLIGFKGKTVKITALNDYAVEIPVSDIANSGLIFATRRDGELMSVRDKGPIFVVFPFDQKPELNTKITQQKSIWQVNRIEAK